MQITKEALVRSPIETVWAFLADVSSVAECVPGFELKEEVGPGIYNGAFTIRVGPIVAKLEGQGRLDVDHDSRTGAIEGKGLDRRGGSRASASLNYSVEPTAEGAKLRVVADVTLSGPLAQVGRTGIINDIADRLTGQFVAEVERRLAGNDRDPKAEGDTYAAGKGAEATEAPKKEFDVGNAVVTGMAGRVRRYVSGPFGKSRD